MNFIFATAPTAIVIDSVHYIGGRIQSQDCHRRPNQGKHVLDFFLKSLLESPGNLLEICLIKFVDTLAAQICLLCVRVVEA